MEQLGRNYPLITARMAASSSPDTIWASLCYLRGLPDATVVVGI